MTKQDYSFQLTDQKYHKFLCVKPLLYPHLKIYVLKNKSSAKKNVSTNMTIDGEIIKKDKDEL